VIKINNYRDKNLQDALINTFLELKGLEALLNFNNRFKDVNYTDLYVSEDYLRCYRQTEICATIKALTLFPLLIPRISNSKKAIIEVLTSTGIFFSKNEGAFSKYLKVNTFKENLEDALNGFREFNDLFDMKMRYYNNYKSHIRKIGLLMLEIANEMKKQEEK
jgi:hypothetical protein